MVRSFGEQLPRIMARLAPLSVVGLCLYAFTISLGNSPAYFVSAALIVPAALLLLVRKELRSNPVILLSLVWMAYVMVLAILSQRSGIAGRHLAAANNFYFISLAPFVAIQVAIAARAMSFAKLAVIALHCALIGGAVILSARAHWSAGADLFMHFANGRGSANRNFMAIVAGITLLASLSLVVFHVFKKADIRPRVAALAFVVAIGVLASVALVSMQSRTSTLAAIVSLAIWGMSCLVILMRQLPRKGIVAALAAGVLATVAVALLHGPVAARFAKTGGIVPSLQTYAGVLLGRSESSIGPVDERGQLFRLAMELIEKKPWFGWATDPSSLLAMYSPWNFVRDNNLIHFHNAYLETVVAVGIVGAMLLIVLIGIMVADVTARRSRGVFQVHEKAATLPFAIAVFVFFGVVGMAESVNRVEFATQAMILTAAFLLARGSVGSAVDAILADVDAGPPGDPQ